MTALNEWTIVYRVYRMKSANKVYHLNPNCKQLKTSYKGVKSCKLGSMLAGKYELCGSCGLEQTKTN